MPPNQHPSQRPKSATHRPPNFVILSHARQSVSRRTQPSPVRPSTRRFATRSKRTRLERHIGSFTSCQKCPPCLRTPVCYVSGLYIPIEGEGLLSSANPNLAPMGECGTSRILVCNQLYGMGGASVARRRPLPSKKAGGASPLTGMGGGFCRQAPPVPCKKAGGASPTTGMGGGFCCQAPPPSKQKSRGRLAIDGNGWGLLSPGAASSMQKSRGRLADDGNGWGLLLPGAAPFQAKKQGAPRRRREWVGASVARRPRAPPNAAKTLGL